MSCEHIDRMADYTLRVLPADEARAVERHMLECDDCCRELAALRSTVGALVDWPTDIVRPPEPLWARLAERIAPTAAREPTREPEARWTDEPPWKQVAPGITCKVLACDEETGMVSMLVRLAPGVAYPAHEHIGAEELHLLDGELWIEDRKLVPGDYNRGEPGTSDQRVWSETGCTCVLVTSHHDILR